MSAAVKLAAKLPGDPETNGVDAHAENLVERPRDLRVAVIWFDVDSVKIDTDTDDHIPTIRVRRIEPLGLVQTAPQELRDLVAESVEQRTGRLAIPFELVAVPDDDPDQLSIDDELEQELAQ